MKPRNVEDSSSGIANTTSNATHAGSCKMCSTRPLMPNIFTHHRSQECRSDTNACPTFTKCLRTMRHGSWHHVDVSVIVVSTSGRRSDYLPRRHARAGEVCSTKRPDQHVHVHATSLTGQILATSADHPNQRAAKAAIASVQKNLTGASVGSSSSTTAAKKPTARKSPAKRTAAARKTAAKKTTTRATAAKKTTV